MVVKLKALSKNKDELRILFRLLIKLESIVIVELKILLDLMLKK